MTKLKMGAVGMKERPILFSGPMVKAILEGRKTQTRRIVKGPAQAAMSKDNPCDEEDGGVLWVKQCPYGQPGDRLWVRETWANLVGMGFDKNVAYRAESLGKDGKELSYSMEARIDFGIKWKPSIHMPRCASRITLEIVSVRVERLQNIGQGDACNEGCPSLHEPIDWFTGLWESINGKGSWEANPFVWVVEFQRVLTCN